MKPPICVLCGKDFRNDMQQGGTVSFKLTPKEQARQVLMQKQRMVGHPPGVHWFCGKHLSQAQPYQHLTWSEARPLLNKKIGLWDRIRSLFR